MQHSGLALFKDNALCIQYSWMTRAERDQFARLFLARDTLFSKVETFLGDRFLLSCPRATPEQLLPRATRQKLARDSLVYMERYSPEMRPLLLVTMQQLVVARDFPVHDVVYRAEYALQQNLPLSELVL
jgi:hypothetical protein